MPILKTSSNFLFAAQSFWQNLKHEWNQLSRFSGSDLNILPSSAGGSHTKEHISYAINPFSYTSSAATAWPSNRTPFLWPKCSLCFCKAVFNAFTSQPSDAPSLRFSRWLCSLLPKGKVALRWQLAHLPVTKNKTEQHLPLCYLQICPY